jgi:hypothetical protein
MTTENCLRTVAPPFSFFARDSGRGSAGGSLPAMNRFGSPAAGGRRRNPQTTEAPTGTAKPAPGRRTEIRVPADPAGDGHTDYISFLQVKTPFLSPASDAAATRHVIVTLRHSSLHEGGLDNLNRGCTRRLLRRVSTFRNNYPDTARTPPALVHGPPRKRSPISSDHWAIQGPTH